jgi:hypothetical protein
VQRQILTINNNLEIMFDLKKLTEAEKILRGQITTFELSDNIDQPIGMIPYDDALKAVEKALTINKN